MVDFRVSDGLPWHPKTVGMTLPALGLWTLCGSWCARYLTDGYIPGDVIRGFAGRHKTAIQELLNRNLLVVMGEGYQFVDWLDYQRSKEDVENERRDARERMRNLRRRRREG